jgi:dUTP pyrophosphatase
MTVLIGKQILERNIVNELISVEKQVQPCGIDLTVSKIEMYKSEGVIDFDNSQRKLPRLEESGTFQGAWHLTPGSYLITLNEIVSVPANCMGIARPRSSLLRMGATICSSVWDPGYVGKSQCMLVVHNQRGIVVHPNAKLLQIVFLKLDKESEKLYSGIYQGENLP